MNEEIKKKYRVLKAVAISGIVNPGEIVELTEAEATNIGIGTYLEEVADEGAAASEESQEATDGDGSDADAESSEQDTGEQESGSASAGEGSEEHAST